MSSLTDSILKVVTYFNLFEYPVTIEEIKRFLDQPFTEHEFNKAFSELTNNKRLFRLNKFYSINKNMLLEHKRDCSNMLASKEIVEANKVASLLYAFPFVKAVAISGSLSKNCSDEKADFDFFIITAPGRLWIARLLLLIYQKFILPAEKKKKVCLNYFVDENGLEIEDKNYYTAMEIVTLLPCHGLTTMNNFYTANQWVSNFFPNYSIENNCKIKEDGFLRKKVEWLLSNKLADKLDNAIMLLFNNRFKKLFNKNIYSSTGFRIGSYLANRHYCKHMPEFFQQKILNKFEDGLKETNSRLTEEVSSNDIKVNVFN